MKKKYLLILFILIFFTNNLSVKAQGKNILTVKGTGFELNNNSFEFTGVSFFNALYNKEFNTNSEVRRSWIRKFNNSGINVLRVWCQWDNTRGFIDGGEGKTMYFNDGSLNLKVLSTLKALSNDADEEGTVILLTLFSRESWNNEIRLSDEASDKAVAALTQELKSYRNLIFQIWNEFDNRTTDYCQIIKKYDSQRLVTNSPGYSGFLGNDNENKMMDYLSPHTTRDDDRHWEVAAKEIEYLILKYQKPVVDDEPARKGTPKFGGPKIPTNPLDHILHIYNVWKVGGYIIYHHDMFQTGYSTEPIPENGIPAPGFSSYHDQVFEFLKKKTDTYRTLKKR